MNREITLIVNEKIPDRVLLDTLKELFDVGEEYADNRVIKLILEDITLFTKQEEKKLKRILKKYSGYLVVHHYINCDMIEIELPDDADLSDSEEFYIDDLECDIDSFKPGSINRDWLKRVTGFEDEYIGDDINESDGPYQILP